MVSTFDVTDFWRHTDVNAVEDARYRSHYLPQHYVHQPQVTDEIVGVMQEYVKKDSHVLELGCSVGRNLAALKEIGYTNLYGVEINQKAVDLGRQTFNLDGIEILVGSIEDVAMAMGAAHDCIFTQGVLMHLPPSSEWVFSWIAENTRRILITRENEKYSGKFQWARDYGEVFGSLGLKEIEQRVINGKLRLRVFTK